MNGITHKIGGACTGIVLATSLFEPEPITYSLLIGSSILGSLYPDIDEPNSIVGQKVTLLSKVVKKIFGHRGLIHTPFNMTLLTVGLYLLHLYKAPNWIEGVDYAKIPWMLYITIGFFAGYLSHIILDLMTPQGIMLFFPITDKKFNIFNLRGKRKDFICSALLIAGTGLYIMIKYKVLNVELNKDFFERFYFWTKTK